MSEVARVGSYSFHLHAMMTRAKQRCLDVSQSERMLGYIDTADAYQLLAEEVESLALWASQEERRMGELTICHAHPLGHGVR
jgi:hypothetical protein